MAPSQVHACSDIELAYRVHFAPGEGYLVYAGTGSIGAWIDGQGQLHRAGGRGVLLDDGGGGYWIAREALRHIWRNEDETPGQWRNSPLAQTVFDYLGGPDWSATRSFMYGRERGEIGQLARAVAASADADPAARAILVQAGRELARLATALCTRFGPRPVLLAGRAATLHPLIQESLRATLPAGVTLAHSAGLMHHGAARLARAALAGHAAWPPLSAPASPAANLRNPGGCT
jgi:N-acetylglucosamine kinase-like BadF-type ATPase